MPNSAPALLALAAMTGAAQDWPQFLGPARNGVYSGAALATAWPSKRPPLVWEKQVGQGFSGPVAAEGRLILFHRLGDRETVECLEAGTGRRLWSYDYPTAYRDDFGFDEGPRSTPAVAAGRVYTFGAQGMLHCLSLAAGKKIWSLDTHRQFNARKGFFGAACSPLIEQGRVLLNVGGTAGVAAFDAESGKTLWTATSDEAGYSSPVAATIGGTRHALFFTRHGLVSADPLTGNIRFQFPWRSRSEASVNAAVPLVIENLIFLSASYGTGGAALEVRGNQWKQLWSSDEALSNHYATSVYREGYLYGYHGRQEEGPSLRCVEIKTGKVQWSVDAFRAGTITLAGGHLVVLRENGELVLAPASPMEFRPIARAPLLPGPVRAHPALAHGLLYLRNEKTLACVRIQQ